MKNFTIIITLFVSFNLNAQNQKKEILNNVEVSSTKAFFLGKTEKIIDLVPIRSTTSATKNQYRKDKATPPNFKNRGKSKVVRPELEHLGPDPIRQVSIENNRGVAIDPIINIEGKKNGSHPHDPTGAAGLTYYLQAINSTQIGVYNKDDGTLALSFTGNTLWSTLDESSLGDPIILYDSEYDRWLITEFADPANLLIAMSDSSDPTGSYYVYSFSTPEFPDYPKYGIWTTSYILTTNEGSTGALHQYFFDRAALIAGDESVTMQRVEITGNTNTEAGFYVTTPVNWVGEANPEDNQAMAVKINDSSWGEVDDDVVEIFAFDIDFEDVENTTVTKTSIITTPFDSYPCDDLVEGTFSCLSQGSTGGLDAIPEVIMNVPNYRNFGTHESMVLNFITDVNDGSNLSGIRWMELRRTDGDWELYQEGTFAPDDNLHRYMGSIAMDGNGNIGLAYSVSGPEEFAGIRFTGRFSDDPLGEMTVEEYEVVEGNSAISSYRFGDYSHMSVDPSDDMTFWHTGEYGGNGSGSARTRIFSFRLEKKDYDLSISDIIYPETSSELTDSESVVVEIENTGNFTAENYTLTLYLDGEEIQEAIDGTSLSEGESLEYTFTTSIDLSEIGDYLVEVEILYEQDESSSNNNFKKNISHLYDTDVAIELELPSTVCLETLDGKVLLTNNGQTTITTASIDLMNDGEFQETVEWSGSIEMEESEEIEIVFDDLTSGNNNLSVVINEVNGSEGDENSENNTSNAEVSIDNTKKQVKLKLTLDSYPEETTWHLKNDEDEIIFSGGPYEGETGTILEDLCVDEVGCYTFTIEDSYGDGICCDLGEGSYIIEDVEGNELVIGDGIFESSKSDDFCLEFECLLTATLSTSDDIGGEGGSIMIDAQSGEDIEYSIDGGSSFSTKSLFENLEAGDYSVVIKSDQGQCIIEENVTISFVLDTSPILDGLKIIPNPSNGIFKLQLQGYNYIDGFLNIEILNINGQIIQKRKFSRYNESFEGTISLYAYPNGIYFIKLVNLDTNRLIKVVKN
ncbi:MAG: T9SS type A sorting domain-containing protein [Reichenbachiella sp.]|uniref:T9SS type A sorting domain-containing protein n=1 Tax=Reichenbachiella sp. TaxID=2184521 RepID=UPI003297AC09